MYLKTNDAALMNGLLLSARSRLPAPLEEAFARTGTIHVLSVSGLHMAVLATFLAWAFRLFAAPRPAAGLAGIAVLWLFALASGGSPAALRSALMASLVLAAPFVRRRVLQKTLVAPPPAPAGVPPASAGMPAAP
jgi:competence protein ComEC